MWRLKDQFYIKARADTSLNPDGQFIMPGDSGSVLVNDQMQAVGLLHSGGDGMALACDLVTLATLFNFGLSATPGT